MTLALRAHGENQTLNLPWLEQAPSHWQVQRAKNIFSVVDVRSTEGREELLTVSSNDGVRKRSSKAVTMFMAESYAGHKLCWPGDLVVNSLWAWARGLGVTNYHGIISTAYSVYRPKAEFTGYSEFFHHLLRSVPYNWEFTVRSKGIWISRLQLTDQSFLEMPILVPLPEEQEQIVRFVRHLDSKVNRLIKAKRRLIELLNEQKQAIIHQAVTRGLDPTVPLKPSGIDWLGDIPAHWAVRKVAHLFRTIGSGTTPTSSDRSFYEEGSIPWVITGDLKNGELFATSKHVTEQALRSFSALKVFPAGSIVVAMYGATIGKVGLLRMPACVNQACCVLSEGNLITPEYALQQFVAFRAEIARLGIGGGQPNISQDIIRQLRLPIPPLSEQDSILKLLQVRTAGFDTAISKATAEIELIREYRTRLVADVVTGQLDVRQHPWVNTEIEDSTEAITDEAELEDDLEETDNALEEAGV